MPVGAEIRASVAPLDPAYLEALVDLPGVTMSSEAGSHGLGERPAPQAFSGTRGMQTDGTLDRGPMPATYDLRTAWQGHTGAESGTLRDLLVFRLIRVSRVLLAARRSPGLLRGPHGAHQWLRQRRRSLQLGRQHQHVHRLPGPLGRPGQRERRRLRGRLHTVWPDRAQARAGGQVDPRPWYGARQRERQERGHAVRRRLRLDGLVRLFCGLPLLQRDDAQLLLQRQLEHQPRRPHRRLGRHLRRRQLRQRSRRRRRLHRQEQLGLSLGERRVLLRLLLRLQVRPRRPHGGVRQRGVHQQLHGHLPVRSPG